MAEKGLEEVPESMYISSLSPSQSSLSYNKTARSTWQAPLKFAANEHF
jgi:hypothetical protein